MSGEWWLISFMQSEVIERVRSILQSYSGRRPKLKKSGSGGKGVKVEVNTATGEVFFLPEYFKALIERMSAVVIFANHIFL
jgi:hypothetical protein